MQAVSQIGLSEIAKRLSNDSDIAHRFCTEKSYRPISGDVSARLIITATHAVVADACQNFLEPQSTQSRSASLEKNHNTDMMEEHK